MIEKLKNVNNKKMGRRKIEFDIVSMGIVNG
jgi:hypothetical protein